MTYPERGSAEIIERSCASTAAILQRVCAADFGQPTPCRLWTVKDLVNHIIDSAASFAASAEGGAMATGEEPDRTAGDFQAAYQREADRVVAAFSAPGAMDKIMEMPWGGVPGSVVVWIAAGDIFTHGWDLARATGQPSDLDPDLAGRLLAQIENLLPDDMRGPEGEAPFGPKVEVPGSAPAADRLAAFQGRHP